MMKLAGVVRAQATSGKVSTQSGLEAESDADEALQNRIIGAIGDAVEEVVRDHRRAGNPIAEWREGRVDLVPPDQIGD